MVVVAAVTTRNKDFQRLYRSGITSMDCSCLVTQHVPPVQLLLQFYFAGKFPDLNFGFNKFLSLQCSSISFCQTQLTKRFESEISRLFFHYIQFDSKAIEFPLTCECSLIRTHSVCERLLSNTIHFSPVLFTRAVSRVEGLSYLGFLVFSRFFISGFLFDCI